MSSKSVLLLLSATTLFGWIGCTTYRPPNTVTSQMDYLQPDKTPDYPLPKVSILSNPVGSEQRSLASQPHPTATHSEASYKNRLSLSNRQLYFSLLRDQFRTLKQLAPTEANQNPPKICPHFHTQNFGTQPPLATQEQRSAWSYPLTARKELLKQGGTALVPEGALLISDPTGPLPLTTAWLKSETTPQIQMDQLKKSLITHLSNINQELDELCNYGISNNFYIFENLVTYFKTSTLPPRPQHLTTLLKSNLVVNQLLIHSLQSAFPSRLPATTGLTPLHKNDLEMELYGRLQAPWFSEYLRSLEAERTRLRLAPR